MSVLDRLMESFQAAIHGARDWPPNPKLAEHWLKIESYRRRRRNDLAEMLSYTPYFSTSFERSEAYTPVPLAQEVAGFSAELMFSAPVKITLEANEESLAEVLEANALDPFLQESAETLAVEGRGALRIIRDDPVSPVPLITYVNEDKVIWDERHGRFVVGGVVIIEVEDERRGDVYRLLEHHSPGFISRKLFRGKTQYLGKEADFGAVPEFDGMVEEEQTGLDVPTLIRWDNVPGGRSDIAGTDVLLDRINEEYSRGTLKSRASNPLTFAHRSLADESGRIGTDGVILVGEAETVLPELGSQPKSLPIETVQPSMQATEQIAWIDYLVDSSLMFMGYSKASYGRDNGGSADSGKALRLRQSRTLLKKAGKDRMAREAITTALATALAWHLGASSIADFRPKVEFGDGLPRDTLEDAQEIQVLSSADAISTEEKVRRFNPSWTEEQISEEVARIESSVNPNPLTAHLGNILNGGGI